MKKRITVFLLMLCVVLVAGCANSGSRYTQLLEDELDEYKTKMDELEENLTEYFPAYIHVDDIPDYIKNNLPDYVKADELKDEAANLMTDEQLQKYADERSIISTTAQNKIDALEYEYQRLAHEIGMDLYNRGEYAAAEYIFEHYYDESWATPSDMPQE